MSVPRLSTYHLLQLFSALTVIFAPLAAPSMSHAEGLVTARPCPWTCNLAGVHISNCRNWRVGNLCYVEDLSKRPPEHSISSPPQGADSLSSAPSNGKLSASRPFPTRHPIGKPPPWQLPGGIAPAERPEPAATSCLQLRGKYLAAPRIYISEVEPFSDYAGDRYRVDGVVEGICITESGVFRYGRRVRSLGTNATPQLRRFRFTVFVDRSENPELKAYNINGDVAQTPIFTSP